jgi:3-phosphoglycerate kinase
MNIPFIDEAHITNKKVILRVDYNVTLNKDRSVADDFRITQSIPTLQYLLKNNNSVILVSHLGRPDGVEKKYSLAPVVDYLNSLLPHYTFVLLDTISVANAIKKKANTVYVLENIRFFDGEKKNDPEFSEKLALLADVYVNDAFGASHRKNASITGITEFLPSYGGLLLKKELHMIDAVIKNPKHPVVAIIGGSKVSTKIKVIEKLMEVADCLLVGGGLANTFFVSQGLHVGSSLFEKEAQAVAERLLQLADKKKTKLVLPTDVVIGNKEDADGQDRAVKVNEILPDEKKAILDIGPETQAEWGNIIAGAKTIIWNGPVGYIEHPSFSRGTDFIYYSITENTTAVSLVGGGETLTALSKKEYLDKITHISTGGGAMLEYIEKGTLPGIEALKKAKN